MDGSASRRCDTDGSTTVRVYDGDEREKRGLVRRHAGGKIRAAAGERDREKERARESEKCLGASLRHRGGRNTRATGERQVSSTSFISRRLVRPR